MVIFHIISIYIYISYPSDIYKPSIDLQWISIDVGESEAQDICGHFGLAGVAPVSPQLHRTGAVGNINEQTQEIIGNS